ncbi:MAG: 4'-phosphopantetheinyl transferase superfamily protein [Pseudomonadota bacterium]
MHVWHVDLARGRCDLRTDFPEILSAGERHRLSRIAQSENRLSYRVAHSTLWHWLAAYLDITAHSIRFMPGPHGKPMLPLTMNRRRLSFNLSHSGQRIAIAICRHADVGVDVERLRSGVRARSLAEGFFAPEEQQLLLPCDPHSYRLAFFQLWALKEANIKALGAGLSHRLDRFALDWRSARPSVTRCDLGKAHSWTLRRFPPFADYKGAIAVKRCNARIRHFTL